MKAVIDKLKDLCGSSDGDPLIILTILAPIMTIFGIVTYSSGWSYLAHYYDYFGMSLGDADIGLYGVLIHGVSAMQIGWGKLIVFLYVLLGFILIFTRANSVDNRKVSLLAGLAVLVIIVMTSWLAALAGTAAATIDAGPISSLPNITFNPDIDSKCIAGKLVRRKGNTYFVARIQSCKPSKDPTASISLGIITAIPSDTIYIDHYMR